MNINTSTFYRLKNKESGDFLHKHIITKGFAPTSSVKQHKSLPNENGQQWLLVKININGDDYYMVANRYTGQFLFGNNDGEVYQSPPDPENSHQHWNLVRVENGTYRLKNRQTEKYLQGGITDAEHFLEAVTGPGSARADVKLKSSSASSSQQWEFVRADQISNEGPKIPGDISDDELPLPVLKGHKSQAITDKILVSSTRLSYSFVNDPNLSAGEQINKSPYYRLNSYVYWLGKSQLFIGNASSSAENEVTLSTTITNGTEVSKTETETFTVGASVTASAGTSFAGVDVSLEVTASTEWSDEKSETKTSSYEESITVSQRVAAPPYKSIQLFYRVVEEQLVRGDGTIARKWVIASGETQADEYPNKSDKSDKSD